MSAGAGGWFMVWMTARGGTEVFAEEDVTSGMVVYHARPASPTDQPALTEGPLYGRGMWGD